MTCVFKRAVGGKPTLISDFYSLPFSPFVHNDHTKMDELPKNRLRCTDCKAFRSIADFPFDHGFRRSTCSKCQTWQTNRREVEAQRQQLHKEKLEGLKEQARQRQEKEDEYQRPNGLPLCCRGCNAFNCYCKPLQKWIDPWAGLGEYSKEKKQEQESCIQEQCVQEQCVQKQCTQEQCTQEQETEMDS
jgi:hypothetical protein